MLLRPQFLAPICLLMLVTAVSATEKRLRVAFGDSTSASMMVDGRQQRGYAIGNDHGVRAAFVT
jgi:hypothetical protein